MKVLVIGGTRFIGPAVVRRLGARGCKVTLFHRGEHERGPSGVEHIHGERERIGEYRPDFERAAPDVVLDMAPMSGADAEAVLGAVEGIAARVVAVSSVDVYRAYGRVHGSEPGDIEPMPLREDSPLREKLYPYRGERDDASFDVYDKIPVERAVMSAKGIAGTVVRLPAVYGEGDYQRRMFMVAMRFEARRPFVLWQEAALNWRWPRAYVENVAEAIALAVSDARAAGRVYNAPTDAPLTQGEWTAEYGRVAGWEGEVLGLPDELLPPHLKGPENYEQDLVVDGSRMRAELGYGDVVPWEEAVRRALAWEVAHPPKRMNPRVLDYALEDAAVAEWRTRGGE